MALMVRPSSTPPASTRLRYLNYLAVTRNADFHGVLPARRGNTFTLVNTDRQTADPAAPPWRS